jgi:hypothetical protein
MAALAVSSGAAAHHLENLDTPYPSRGACEAAVADFNNDDWDMLRDRFPTFFSSQGEVASFLTRAFPCEQSEVDGQWYIQDRLVEVLGSDWYQRRK